MDNLLSVFVEQILTPEFLWVVIATTFTMEFAKRFIPEKLSTSNWYPLFTAIIAAAFLILKTTITGSWKEYAANFFFTIILVDFIYTVLGKHIIKGVIAFFKKKMGITEEVS